MNASELREKTPDQLKDELANLKKESFNLRFQQATGAIENTARMRSVRRNTARVMTILNEKAAEAAYRRDYMMFGFSPWNDGDQAA